MKVSELIEKLKKLNQDLDVVCYDNEYADFDEAVFNEEIAFENKNRSIIERFDSSGYGESLKPVKVVTVYQKTMKREGM